MKYKPNFRRRLVARLIFNSNPICPHCGKKVQPSFTEPYSWQCYYCDEDFMNFEVSSTNDNRLQKK